MNPPNTAQVVKTRLLVEVLPSESLLSLSVTIGILNLTRWNILGSDWWYDKVWLLSFSLNALWVLSESESSWSDPKVNLKSSWWSHEVCLKSAWCQHPKLMKIESLKQTITVTDRRTLSLLELLSEQKILQEYEKWKYFILFWSG